MAKIDPAALHDAVNELLALAYAERGDGGRFANDAVNWADLRCVSVVIGEEWTSNSRAEKPTPLVSVTIEEASPDGCEKLSLGLSIGGAIYEKIRCN